jgi:hypothetical protein
MAEAEHVGETFDGLPRELEIVEELGKGSFGVVFWAKNPKLKRDEAIKIAHPHEPIDDSAQFAQALFVAEAQHAAALEHEAIAGIFDVGNLVDGRPYIRMPYYAGGSLDKRLRSGALPAKEVASLMAIVCDGVHHAHTKGQLVHCDLKPENILLDRDGKPRVADFGVAKLKDKQTRIGGTPAYMSPEAVLGNPSLDGRADVWAIGVILYVLLTGRRPFSAVNQGQPHSHCGREHLLLAAILSAQPEPCSEIVAGVPRELERICLKCLEKEPKERYQTASAVARDLRNFLHPRPWYARTPFLVFLAVLILVAGVVAFSIWLQRAASAQVAREVFENVWHTEEIPHAQARVDAARSPLYRIVAMSAVGAFERRGGPDLAVTAHELAVAEAELAWASGNKNEAVWQLTFAYACALDALQAAHGPVELGFVGDGYDGIDPITSLLVLQEFAGKAEVKVNRLRRHLGIPEIDESYFDRLLDADRERANPEEVPATRDEYEERDFWGAIPRAEVWAKQQGAKSRFKWLFAPPEEVIEGDDEQMPGEQLFEAGPADTYYDERFEPNGPPEP